MATVAVIAVLTCAALIALVLFKPSVQIRGNSVSIYYMATVAGALALLAFGCVTLPEIGAGLAADGDMNPLKVLTLFLSMTLISVFLDNAGFFRRLASWVLERAKTSQRALFVYLYLMVSVLTMFTSNDIVILTFTPFICYFAAQADINPMPYLFCEFVAANTWSMALIIGNPTNIYLAAGAGIGFMEYIKVMLLPTLLAGVTSFGLLWWLLRRELSMPLRPHKQEPPAMDKGYVALGVGHLLVCIVVLSLSSYLSVQMWLVSLIACVSLFALAAVGMLRKKKGFSLIRDTLRCAPWETVPFVISMFVLVLALGKVGWTGRIGDVLSGRNLLLNYGAASFLASNVINNIPMSILFAPIVGELTGLERLKAIYATVIGSNVGAFFTPLGALAGIMWTNMLRHHGVRVSFAQFIRLGVTVAVPALLAALLGLWIVF